jgi:hypothetical protein
MRFFLLIILFASINAQSIITGRVTDAKTGNPLVGVNIFFSRTTYGSTTDKNGFYTLDDIPLGRYELLVSMIGYKVAKESFQIDTDIKIERDYKLVSQPIRMKEIVVSAKSNREWKKNYRRFKSAFLGMSWNAEYCRIMNDYVLSFKKNGNLLEAFASEPLIIENKGLGYRVIYTLEDFSDNKKTVRYSGDPFFEEMEPESSRESREWEKNRNLAYRGSFRHFLYTLSSRFDARFDIEADSLVEIQYWQRMSGSRNDPLIQEGFKVYLPKNFSRYDPRYLPLGSDTLMFLTENENELYLVFKGKMKIIYNKESEEHNFTPEQRGQDPKPYQTSFITLNKEKVIVDKKGRYVETYMIEQQGEMAWERVADQLPWDYLPTYHK